MGGEAGRLNDRMTPEQFIAKWQANTRGERAACQEHFIDLCRLLDEPTPNTDPNSIMNSVCLNWTAFTTYDLLAIRTIYPR